MPSVREPVEHHLPDRFRLGSWVVDPRAAQLKRGSETVRLEPKVMGVLNHLAAHAGEVVSRGALLDAVWPDVVVTENVLSRCISELRRALGDDPRTPTVIETIPKMGYRLLLPIEPVEEVARAFGPTEDGVATLGNFTSPVFARASAARSRGWIVGLALLGLFGLGLASRIWTSKPPPVLFAETPRPVTAMRGSESMATISPAGDRIAYVRLVEGGQMGHIELVGTAGGSPRQLTQSNSDTFPAFSPDGQHLAFLRCEGVRCRPYRISALGTDERPMADVAAYPAGLAWSPDGHFLAFVGRDSETTPLYVVVLDIETGQTRRLTTPPATVLGDIFPAFSPDGRRLAFVRRTDAEVGDLHVVSTEGGDPVAISGDRSQISRFCWFSDGRTLLASSNRDGTYRLWRYSTEGDPPTALFLEAEMPIGPTLSSQDDKLVVEAWDLPIQLGSYDLTSPASARRALAPSTRLDRMPSLSPDGRRAVFVSTRSGHAELWVVDVDGDPPRQLTSLAGPSVRTPEWSPDGRHIAFVMQTDGQYDVYTLLAEGGIPQRLTNTSSDETHPRWSPDSHSIFVGRRSSERWEGVRLALDGSEDTVLIPDAVALAPSNDGHTLWYSRDSTPGLWALAVEAEKQPELDGEPRLLVPDLADDDAASWSVTHDGIVYLRRTDDDTEVVRWTDGRSELLLEGPLHLDLWAPALGVSLDGSIVLLAQMGLPEIDILIADLVHR